MVILSCLPRDKYVKNEEIKYILETEVVDTGIGIS